MQVKPHGWQLKLVWMGWKQPGLQLCCVCALLKLKQKFNVSRKSMQSNP
jgi:hypothetical protein